MQRLSDLVANKYKRDTIMWRCAAMEDFAQSSKRKAFGGTWFFSGDLSTFSAKDKKAFESYLAKPGEFGVCVITSTDFKDFKDYINKFDGLARCVAIKLSFPRFSEVRRYVKEQFTQTGIKLSERALDEFCGKIGGKYSLISYFVDLLSAEAYRRVELGSAKQVEVTIKDIHKAIVGIGDYDMDDFMKRLAKGVPSDKARTNALYQAFGGMLVELGLSTAVRRVISRVDRAIGIRLLVNDGVIPAGNTFRSVAMVEQRVARTKTKHSGYGFRAEQVLSWSDIRLNIEVDIAATTSLADWVWIMGELCKLEQNSSEAEALTRFVGIMARRVI
jgi:hypothetical protein